MMPIGKTIPVMGNEEKIYVVWEGLISDKTTEKISFVPAGCDNEKIGVVLEKVGVCPRPAAVTNEERRGFISVARFWRGQNPKSATEKSQKKPQLINIFSEVYIKQL